MIHFYYYSVKPSLSHPKYWEAVGGWAEVYLRADKDSRAIADEYLSRHFFEVIGLLTSREIPPELYHMLPKEVLPGLDRFPVYCAVTAYASGSEIPKRPPWLPPEDGSSQDTASP